MKFLKSLRRGMLDLLYPPTCLGCSTRCTNHSLPLCTACQHALEEAEPETVRNRLTRLPAASGLFTIGFSLWTFDAGVTLQSLQHKLKYGNRPSIGIELGRLMGQGYQNREYARPDLILPIPLHSSRRLERGYNQSFQLAVGLAQVLEAPVRNDVLVRARATQSQTDLARKDRWRNVNGAFGLKAYNSIRNTHVLLVDDVLTTGSTLTAAAKILSKHASDVSLATLGIARA